MEPIEIELSQKPKTFSEFFSAVLNSRLNFEYFPIKLNLIANIFLKSRTRKTAVR